MSGLIGLAVLGAFPLDSAQAEQATITARASIVKSLTLTKKQDLDFGTITLSGAAGTYTVSITPAGVLSCPAGATCAGPTVPAIMNVQGSNRQTVRITIGGTNLVNPIDGSQLAFTPSSVASVTLPNSGAPGIDFNIGGSIVIPSTADGTYVGNVTVTAEYQ